MHDSNEIQNSLSEPLSSERLESVQGGCGNRQSATGGTAATPGWPSAGTLEQPVGAPTTGLATPSGISGMPPANPGTSASAFSTLLQPLQALEQAIQALQQSLGGGSTGAIPGQ
jgi:hypothetical protein